jgi:hypothetical protein
MKDSNLQPPDEEKAISGNIINIFRQLEVQKAAKCGKYVAPFAPYSHPTNHRCYPTV